MLKLLMVSLAIDNFQYFKEFILPRQFFSLIKANNFFCSRTSNLNFFSDFRRQDELSEILGKGRCKICLGNVKPQDA
jgi:hypothetical protein